MATVNVQFTAQVGYAGTYRVIAYTQADPLTIVNQIDINPPFTIPVNVSLAVPTLETHIVKIFALQCNKLVGQIPVTPPSQDQFVVFKNMMSSDGSTQITSISIDAGANILVSPIADNGSEFTYSSNPFFATNPHSIQALLSGIMNGTDIKTTVYRSLVNVYQNTVVYSGGATTLVTGFSFQNGDLIQVEAIPPAVWFQIQNNVGAGVTVNDAQADGNTIVLSNGYPVNSGDSDDSNVDKPANPNTDIFVSYNSSVDNVKILLYDTNGVVVACKDITIIDLDPTFTVNNVDMSGTQPIIVVIEPGSCI